MKNQHGKSQLRYQITEIPRSTSWEKLNQIGPSRCKPSQAFRLCKLILFKTEWINLMASPQKKLLRHFTRQNYQNCFHLQEKNIKSWQDVWKSSLTGSDGRSWHSCCLRRKAACTEPLAGQLFPPQQVTGCLSAFLLPLSTAWRRARLRAGIFTPFFSRNSPNIFSFLWYIIRGWVWGFQHAVIVQSHPSLERIVGLQPCSCGFPLLLTSLQITPKALLRAAPSFNKPPIILCFGFLFKLR